MKFKLLKKCSEGRLGIVSDVERLSNFTLETPNLLFYTKRGCVPHLTYDVMQMLTKSILPLQFPLDNLFHCCEVMEKTRTSLNTFVGLPEYFSYCFVQDPTSTIPQGYHRGACATLWTAHGKMFVSRERYMEIMEIMQPDMYVALSDGDTNLNCSMKRLCNSVHITNDAFEYCYNKHASSILKNKGLIAPIEGGYNKSMRERCVNYMSKFPVLGYLIDGLYTDGINVNRLPFASVEEIVEYTTKLLPEEQLRIIHGAWNPKSVIKLVKLGIDLFDTSFPCFLTEKGCALSFDFNVENLLHNETMLYDDCEIDLQSEENVEGEEKIVENVNMKNPLYINLRSTRFFDDLTPVLENCSCLTCTNHTRAYIHHLLVSKELLGPVLLTIHNLHHYSAFFHQIRLHLHENNLEKRLNGF